VGDLGGDRLLYCIGRWYWDGAYLFSMYVLGVGSIPLLVLSVPYVLWLDRRLKEPRDGAWHFGQLVAAAPTASTARCSTISSAAGRSRASSSPS
jgi:hypothetical protein